MSNSLNKNKVYTTPEDTLRQFDQNTVKTSSSDLMEEDDDEEQKRMKLKLARKLNFFCWTSITSPYSSEWDCWVKKMCSVHRSTWERAGIYEAMMNSTYVIQRHEELILELASRWCSETNTFGFPWGNATLILEDMSVLGGFSASGVSALSSLENDQSRQIIGQLETARTQIIRSASRAALQGKWIKKFKESESELEHAAFLTLWLSRHVFPSSTRSKVINKQVIPVAAMLSRGIKVALAPVVLASIYRDLGLLAKSMAQLLAHLESEDSVNLCAPLHLVQIWAWERFPMLKPVPNYVVDKFPRLARWSNVNIRNEEALKSTIDSAGKEFLWIPYGSSFGRRIEPIELKGMDSSIEKYQPQLVVKQFGLDDDILSDDIDKDSGQESLQKQERCSDVKLGKIDDCVLQGSNPQVIILVESDSDSDLECSILDKKVLPPKVVEGEEGRSNSGLLGARNSSCFDVERNANERLSCLGSGFNLEARITRLEDIVYANKRCRKNTCKMP